MRKKLTFKNPGIDIGDKTEGDMVEAVAEFEVEDGGKLCLKSVNGIPLADYAKEEMMEGESESSGERVMSRAMAV